MAQSSKILILESRPLGKVKAHCEGFFSLDWILKLHCLDGTKQGLPWCVEVWKSYKKDEDRQQSPGATPYGVKLSTQALEIAYLGSRPGSAAHKQNNLE